MCVAYIMSNNVMEGERKGGKKEARKGITNQTR
jgi:hypothetical protein